MRVDEMAHVNLAYSEEGTRIHIRQLKTTEQGVVVVNDDGISLSADEFAALLYQMNAIERSFLTSNSYQLSDNLALFNNYEPQLLQPVENTTHQPQANEKTVQPPQSNDNTKQKQEDVVGGDDGKCAKTYLKKRLDTAISKAAAKKTKKPAARKEEKVIQPPSPLPMLKS
jgi:hypothetical protein